MSTNASTKAKATPKAYVCTTATRTKAVAWEGAYGKAKDAALGILATLDVLTDAGTWRTDATLPASRRAVAYGIVDAMAKAEHAKVQREAKAAGEPVPVYVAYVGFVTSAIGADKRAAMIANDARLAEEAAKAGKPAPMGEAAFWARVDRLDRALGAAMSDAGYVAPIARAASATRATKAAATAKAKGQTAGGKRKAGKPADPVAPVAPVTTVTPGKVTTVTPAAPVKVDHNDAARRAMGALIASEDAFEASTLEMARELLRRAGKRAPAANLQSVSGL